MTSKPKKSKELQAINLLLKALKKDFIGKYRCEEFEVLCPKCIAQHTKSYLLWLKDQYES